MALAVSIIDSVVEGNKRIVTADVTFDSSYPTGGEAVTLSTLGLNSILFVQMPGAKVANLLQYDYAANKILAYVSSTGSQVANTTDLSAVSFRARFVGN